MQDKENLGIIVSKIDENTVIFMYIKRHLEEQVISLSKTYPVILITGPRQAGKTTMLQELAAQEKMKRSYVSLDDLNARELARSDPQTFLQRYEPPVLIDEVQYAPELFTYIKIYVDQHQTPGDYWLTGSQIYRLMRGVQESMAGRVALLHMSPLSQREITGSECVPFTTDFDVLLEQAKIIQPVSSSDMFKRIWNGCMPGLVSHGFQDRDVFYSSYLSTYMERDIRYLSGTIDILRFFRFITAAAARTSQLVNHKAIADDADITVAECKDWLNILETLGVIFFLHPYSDEVLKRTTKTPKLYFYDTGLVCYLTKWPSPEVAECGAMSGALLENFAVSEIVKGYQNAGREPFIHYYRDKDAKEIDVILERDRELCPIEIKQTATPDRRLIRSFRVIDKSPLQIGTGAVLCLAIEFTAFDREHLIVPIWMV